MFRRLPSERHVEDASMIFREAATEPQSKTGVLIRLSGRPLVLQVFQSPQCDRTEEGNSFIPPDPNMEYTSRLRSMVHEELHGPRVPDSLYHGFWLTPNLIFCSSFRWGHKPKGMEDKVNVQLRICECAGRLPSFWTRASLVEKMESLKTVRHRWE